MRCATALCCMIVGLSLAACQGEATDDAAGFSAAEADREAAGGSGSAQVGEHCEGTPDCVKGLLCAATRLCAQPELKSCAEVLECRDQCIGEGCAARCDKSAPLRVVALLDAIKQCVTQSCAAECEDGRCSQCLLDAQTESCDHEAS